MPLSNLSYRPSKALEQLGPDFYEIVRPAQFSGATLRFWDENLARVLNIDKSLAKQHFLEFQPIPGSLQNCHAMKYHGHQFQHYNPDLGDGRGFTFALYESSESREGLGKLMEFGTKGSGQTPYSRAGDGRLTLKGAVREALCTNYLEALNVKTSKTFCFFETNDVLVRNDEPSPTRAAVLTRLSSGHIRFGTFQRLAYFNEKENIEKLMKYSVQWFYPDLQKDLTIDEVAAAFFKEVMIRHADLVASYMIAGFVHGVLNTDNMNISGESFDYGPYRFLPSYDPNFTAAYFDQQGLYCFGRQPLSFLWNLQRLGEALQKRFTTLPVNEILEAFSDHFNESVQKYFFHRLNLQASSDQQKNSELLSSYFSMQENCGQSFAQIFHDCHSGHEGQLWHQSPIAKFYESDKAKIFLNQLQNFKTDDFNRLKARAKVDPVANSLLIDEIEKIWKPISEKDDWDLFHKKIASFKNLF